VGAVPGQAAWVGGLAGLSKTWRSPAGEWVRSFAIITTKPNELCAELHNRMADGAEAGGMAGLARRGASGPRASSKSCSRPIPQKS
jgi:hypothetical protein